MDKIIKPIKRLTGSLTVPGDKSISHRVLILSAIAQGTSKITNLSSGKDVQSTQNCLTQMGIKIEKEGETILVHGKGLNGLDSAKRVLDAGNSGTTIRLLSGILAAQTFETTITGDSSLQKRPMKRIIHPLRLMGAHIESNDQETSPLRFIGKKLKPISYSSPVASAQVKSCILLAGLYATGRTSVTEPAQSRDHTERLLPCYDIEIKKNNLRVSLDGPCNPQPILVEIPGDISSAAFFIVAASIVPGSNLTLSKIGVNPTRTGILNVLSRMGAQITYQNNRMANNEPVADVTVQNRQLKSTVVQGSLVPMIIDEIPLLAVAGTQAEGKTIIKDAKELRFKETDRIAAVVHNLRSMGVQIDEQEDGFIVSGPQKLRGAVVDSFGDHRIAMSFAVAGLIAEGETTIKGAESAEISYPGFFETLRRLTHD